jgi:NADH:ubiquinone oxidoreductase subunit F (NADH-binding)
LLDLVQAALGNDPPPPQRFEPVRGPFRSDPYATAGERYGTVKRLVSSGVYDAVIPALRDAGLRGMGGAGFPTATKWETVRNARASQKYIVCNADESEVGTFKDREILKCLPHLVVEGMAVGGIVTGASRGYLYIRHEYEEQIEALEAEIHRARRAGVLGSNVLGSGRDFELEIFVSPGGYIQGEETALMEAIEGKRGQPRNKPWDVGFERGVPALLGGLWGKPTIVNNVETLAYVPAILSKGPDWFKSQGVNGAMGLKWIGVSGDVARPGVFEARMGMTYLEVFNQLAGGMKDGKRLKAFAPSGPSFGIYPASMAGLRLDWSTRVEMPPVAGQPKPPELGILGSGAIIGIADGACVLDLALGFVRFFRNESCGKCVPCRVGSQKMADIVELMTQGNATGEDLETIDRLADTLNMTSICGLGQVAGNPILSVLKYFPDEVRDHMTKRSCPSGVCFRERAPA